MRCRVRFSAVQRAVAMAVASAWMASMKDWKATKTAIVAMEKIAHSTVPGGCESGTFVVGSASCKKKGVKAKRDSLSHVRVSHSDPCAGKVL